MKKIEAIIDPSKTQEVKNALTKIGDPADDDKQGR